MKTGRAVAGVAALVAAIALAGRADAQIRMKHSGTVVAIGENAETIVLAEIGPWRIRGGTTVVTRRVITIMPDTELAIVGRDHATPGGLSGDFIEGALERGEIFVNDFVTVDCVHDGERLMALKITVTDVDPP